MSGDTRSRFSESCNRTVHDLSQLTQRQATKLLHRSSTGLCARVTYNPEGRIVFRAVPEPPRIARLVGISLLGASAWAQTPDSKPCTVEVKVSDPSTASVPGAKVSITSTTDPQTTHTGTTDAHGVFRDALSSGPHGLSVAMPGFEIHTGQDVNLSCESQNPITVEFQLPAVIEVRSKATEMMGEMARTRTTSPIKSFFRYLRNALRTR